MTGRLRAAGPARPSTARRVRAGLVAAALLAVAACGGDDDGGSDGNGASTDAPGAAPSVSAPGAAPGAGAGPAGEEQPAELLRVTAVDFELQLEPTELTAGRYSIELVNDGDSSHDLAIERDGEQVAATEAVDPGRATTLIVELEPGEYVLYCSIANHRSMGMEVTVTVT